MMDRPLPSDSKVEWRKYAEELEARLGRFTEVNLPGIRVIVERKHKGDDE